MKTLKLSGVFAEGLISIDHQLKSLEIKSKLSLLVPFNRSKFEMKNICDCF